MNGASVGVTTATYTVGTTDLWIINNYATGTTTLTLPAASSYSGRVLYIQNLSAKKKFFAVVGFALFIGVCVELGEVILNHFLTHPLPFDPSDTIGDILFDILGGVLTWVYYLG